MFAAAHWLGYGVMLASTMLLARRLGVDAFGSLAFAQVLIQYAVLLIEFGYPFGATRRIAALKDDLEARSQVFSAVLACQWLLAALVAAALCAAWLLVPAWRAVLALVMAGAAALAGSALQPAWLFLGLERLKVLAGVQLAAKAVMLALVLLAVHGPADLVRSVFILGLPPLLAGAALLAWSLRSGLVRWRRPTLAMMGRELRGAFEVFAPGAVSVVYTGLPAIVLGAVGPQASLAYFSLADRLKSASLLVLQPFSTTLIARMSVLFGGPAAGAHGWVWRSLAFHATAGGLFSCILFFGADLIVRIVGGAGFAGAATVLRWMAFVPLVVAVSTVASLHVLLPSGRAGVIHRVVLCVSVVGLAGLWPMVRLGGEVGAARFLLASELASCSLMWWFAWRQLRNGRAPVNLPGGTDPAGRTP